MTRRWRLAAALLLTTTGCVADDLLSTGPDRMPTLPPEGGPAVASAFRRGPQDPASAETACRVAKLANQLVEANKSVGLRPLFLTIGTKAPEIFHRGTSEVVVTDGLVRRCDDPQLAAVLCLELGKMASERAALTPPEVRHPEHLPPIEVPIGHDNVGPFGAADGTDHVLQVKHDQERWRPGQVDAPPDPAALARQYLERAGYKPEALDAAAPLLREAEANSTQERQWGGGKATTKP